MWIFCFKSKPEWRVPHPETLQLPEDSCIIVGIGTGWGGIGDCGDHGDRGDGIVTMVIMVINFSLLASALTGWLGH